MADAAEPKDSPEESPHARWFGYRKVAPEEKPALVADTLALLIG